MKKFLLKLGGFVAIQLVILAFVTSYGSLDANTDEYMYALKDKYDLLQQTPSPRIIFVGGSNLAFGLKSSQFKSATGLNPVNMGVHGRLGVYSMTRMVKQHLRPGDVVVVSPEYGTMFRSPECRQEIAAEAYRAWPGCKEFIQPDVDQPLESLVPEATSLRKLGQCVLRARRRLGKPGLGSGDEDSAQDPVECYRRKSFNRFGDHVAHYDAASTYRETGGLSGVDERVFERVADELNGLAQFCQEKKTKLYFLFPPISATKVANHSEQVRHMERLVATKLSFPVLTNLAMATFAEDQFFDGQSHLTEQGAQLRTDIVCQTIQQFERVAGNANESMIR